MIRGWWLITVKNWINGARGSHSRLGTLRSLKLIGLPKLQICCIVISVIGMFWSRIAIGWRSCLVSSNISLLLRKLSFAIAPILSWRCAVGSGEDSHLIRHVPAITLTGDVQKITLTGGCSKGALAPNLISSQLSSLYHKDIITPFYHKCDILAIGNIYKNIPFKWR